MHWLFVMSTGELHLYVYVCTGIPLLHIVSNTVVLENPARISQKAHEEVRLSL